MRFTFSNLPAVGWKLPMRDIVTVAQRCEEVGFDREAIVQEFQEDARDTYREKQKALGLNPDTEQPLLRDVERFVVLQVVDARWRPY